ncbi:MAG: MFS transporter, partial [Pikeienuella sp.]
MRTLISFTALFVSIAFVQLGSGSLGPLDALAGTAKGFSTQDIGMLGSAHFVGFFVGCWLTPRLLGSVGHARAFAAFGAVGAISALLHPIVPDPIAWAGLRIGTGMAVAGAYTIAESWIQAKATNQNRGRVVGAYRVVDMTASVAAQGLVAVLDPTSYVAYNLIAVLCCLCLLPLTLTTSKAPPSPSAPRLRPLRV